jgi:hypothetical protein
MLTTSQLRQAAARSGARDIANVEIDAILTPGDMSELERMLSEGSFQRRKIEAGTLLAAIGRSVDIN